MMGMDSLWKYLIFRNTLRKRVSLCNKVKDGFSLKNHKRKLNKNKIQGHKNEFSSSSMNHDFLELPLSTLDLAD